MFDYLTFYTQDLMLWIRGTTKNFLRSDEQSLYIFAQEKTGTIFITVMTFFFKQKTTGMFCFVPITIIDI